jgi:hypothetical protein
MICTPETSFLPDRRLSMSGPGVLYVWRELFRMLFQHGGHAGLITAATGLVTARRLDRREYVFPGACVDEGCAKPECLQVPAGRRRRACHVHDGASRGERHHKVGLTPDCRQASGNKLLDRRCNRRFVLRPTCEGCIPQCAANRSRRGAKIETWPQFRFSRVA